MTTHLRLRRAAGVAMAAAVLNGGAAGRGETPPALQTQREGNTAFACELYAKLAGAAGDANVFFSPHSISTALAMTSAGARGDTGAQMVKTLHFEPDPAKRHAAFAAMEANLNAVQKKGRVKLSVANSLWPQKDFALLESFLGLVRQNYGASVTPLDFSATETARKTINTWVEDKTNQKIRDLIPGGVLSAATRLVLVNAIYFKGDWASPFMAGATRPQPFRLLSGQTAQAPLMFQMKHFGYTEDETTQVLEMPYAGDDLSMLVLLPKKTGGLAALENSLTPANLAKWTQSMSSPEVRVYLPKFKMTCRFGLNDTLKAMGMGDAFDPGRADFSGMDGGRNLFISAALHKAFVEVNEQGTEAAAATGIGIALTSLPAPPIEFRADHPFLFLIREKSTDSILFIGRVTNPTVAGE
ncbi:MAG: serpin family protein [Verrucomicrobia bacterium]|nr:serpin family protein [Verrucomicrobiota bacterium]